jgi:hypothetical protein
MKKDLKKVNLGFILQDPKNAGPHNVCTYMSNYYIHSHPY